MAQSGQQDHGGGDAGQDVDVGRCTAPKPGTDGEIEHQNNQGADKDKSRGCRSWPATSALPCGIQGQAIPTQEEEDR